VTAGETSLGWEPGTFGKVDRENRSDALALGAEYDPVTAAIDAMVRTRDAVWEGIARKLLDMLGHQIFEGVRKGRRRPTTPRGLSDALTRAIPTLRHLEIDITRSRARTRDQNRITTIMRRNVG
jgi:hypothetical protein